MTNKFDIPILGADATPEQVQRFLKKIDLKKCRQGDKWVSPITGETYDTYQALCGHVGARARDRSKNLVPLTPDRNGYMNAVRRGVEPTQEQRDAHRDYMRYLRKKKRVEEAGQVP